jgi:16S rRNA C1402 N4-methylase RsmH
MVNWYSHKSIAAIREETGEEKLSRAIASVMLKK